MQEPEEEGRDCEDSEGVGGVGHMQERKVRDAFLSFDDDLSRTAVEHFTSAIVCYIAGLMEAIIMKFAYLSIALHIHHIHHILINTVHTVLIFPKQAMHHELKNAAPIS